MWCSRVVGKLAPVLVLGGVPLTGCVPDYFDEGTATRSFVLSGVNGGNVLSSDVRQDTNICPDSVPVRVENHAKNPNTPGGGFRDDIVIERYEVRYFRSDGRGTQGVDVPFTISGNVAFQVVAEAASNVNIEVVRRQAKTEPPLANIVVGETGAGPKIITMFAEITLHARTTTGVATNSATGRLQIDFADFVNDPGDTTCPTN
jgi:hypothetical protein